MVTKKPATKTTVKRAPAKTVSKTSVKRVSRSAARAQAAKSFRVAEPEQPFMTFRVTRQTIYWTILAIAVLLLGLWVIDINDRVQMIYDQVDHINTTNIESTSPKKP